MAHRNSTMSGYPPNHNMYEYPPNPNPTQSFPSRPPDNMFPPTSHPSSLQQSPSLPNAPFYPPTSAPYPPSPTPSYNPHQYQQHPHAQPLSAPPGPFLPPQYDHAPPNMVSQPPPPVSLTHPAVPQNHSPLPTASHSYNHAYMPQPPISQHMSIVSGPPVMQYHPYHPQQTPQHVLQTAEVKLEISAKGLRDRDLTSKSDPTCVVFLEEKTTSPFGYPSAPGHGDTTSFNQEPTLMKWRELARTECIKNNLNPHFKVHIPVPYHFEEIQHIRMGLWDIDSRKRELGHHDFLGDVRTTVGELVTAGVWTSKLSSPNIKDKKTILGRLRDLGTITIIAHEHRDGGQLLIKASMSGHKLDKKDLFTSDPYFILTQKGASSVESRSQLYTSEVIPRNVNPVWKPFQVKAALPKGGGKEQMTLEFLVYDKDRHKKDDEIGKALCSVADLESGSEIPIINDRKRRRRNYKNSGILQFSRFRAQTMPSLVDYLQGGLKLHFSVAVDLTRSNGDPSEPLSLHYRQEYYGNYYIRALTAVANVLRVYTPSDNLFAAFGFGAELPGRPGFTSSCFPLGLGADPHCYGIEGILQAYNYSLSAVKLSGPTNFAPIIDIVSRTARQRPNTQTDQNYDVLLILTDGVVSDFDLTVDRIITASKSVPLSIIIIGIGNRNFKKMHDLDSDEGLLKSRDGTRQADRDICQFVAFRDHEHAPPERLGAAVLAELPGNIVEYFIGACEPPIMPGQRPVAPMN